MALVFITPPLPLFPASRPVHTFNRIQNHPAYFLWDACDLLFENNGLPTNTNRNLVFFTNCFKCLESCHIVNIKAFLSHQ